MQLDSQGDIPFVEGGAAANGEAGGGPSAGPEVCSPGLAFPVTRQVVISGPPDWKHLSSGVDSLDLGLYAAWADDLSARHASLAQAKKSAEGTKGILWTGPDKRAYIVFAHGSPPTYAYRLQSPFFNAAVAKPDFKGNAPNVYLSLSSQALWLLGVRPAVKLAENFVERLVGKVGGVQVSRCDLCVDFRIPGGLSLDFLQAHVVARSRAETHHVTGGCLETYYAGTPGSSIRLRIYDKAKEILAKHGEKLWFLSIWKETECKDIWRVEFQLRRELFKQLKINSLDELIAYSSGIWRYLTGDWFSLRVNDDENASRRSIHPWWLVVQSSNRDFGPATEVRRKYERGQASTEWYVSHAAGCLVGFATRYGVNDVQSAAGSLASEIEKYWQSRDFGSRYREERIRLGFNDAEEEAK